MSELNQWASSSETRDKFLESWKREGGLSAATLKLIACFFMFFDHLAQSQILPSTGNLHPDFSSFQSMLSSLNFGLISVLFGRLVFPIFCFFIVQGTMLTRDRRKYILRLFIFAFISEIFFDFGLFGRIYWNHQNVFFTLALGALMMSLLDYIHEVEMSNVIKLFLRIATVIGIAIIAELIRSDYGSLGIIALLILWLVRWDRTRTMRGMFFAFFFEILFFGAVYLAIPLIYMYNGKRGNMNKYFFYLFYPIHLMLLWILRMLIVN